MLDVTAIRSTIDDWISDNAERFDPTHETSSRRAPQQMAFSELSLYLYVAQAVDAEIVDEDLHDLVCRTVNSSWYRRAIRRNRHDLLNYGFPVFYTKYVDCLDPATKQVVDETLEGRSVWANERIPCRQMELWHFCQLYGHSSKSYDPDYILKTSSLENPPDIVEATLIDSYALTHNVFFLRNFGIDHPVFKEIETEYDLEMEFTGLLLRYLADDNHDLALEILLAGVLLDQLPKFLVPLTLTLTFRDIGEVGYLQGPSYGRFGSADLRSMDPADRTWAGNYHATLTGAITLRILDDWHETLFQAVEGHPGKEVTFQQFLKLGELLNQLADRDYDSAEDTAERLDNTAVAETYPELYAVGRERLDEYPAD